MFEQRVLKAHKDRDEVRFFSSSNPQRKIRKNERDAEGVEL